MVMKLKLQSLYRTATTAIMLSTMLIGMSALAASDLKERIKVRDVNVRLSDIFTDISFDQDKEVFAAPMPGQSMNISTTKLWNLAQINDIDWEKPLISKGIRVMREGRPVNIDNLETLLSEEMKNRGVSEDVKVSIFGLTKSLYLPVSSDEHDIEISSLTLSPNQNRYRAKLLWPLGDGSFKEIDLNGSIELVRLVPVLNRTLMPGEVIAKSDISWTNVSIKKITATTIQSTENFIGYTPRRAIKANRMLRDSDLESPKFVTKGSQVTISYISGPLVMKTSGKALQHGTIGDSVRILNIGSNKTIIAQVSGPDQVEIIHHNARHQLASR